MKNFRSTVLFTILTLSLLFFFGKAIFSIEANPVKATYRVDHIDPSRSSNPNGAFYPGFRGANQLIIYTPDFNKTTGTNEYGTEITVSNSRVIDKNGSNSIIPFNGFVVSGHGSAKKWLNKNSILGSKVHYDPKTKLLIAITDTESFLYRANSMISIAQKSLKKCNLNISKFQKNRANNYLKMSKSFLKKAKKLFESNPEESIEASNKSYNLAEQAYYSSIRSYNPSPKGVWLRPTEKTTQEIEITIEKISNIGINTVYLETFYHGYTIYPSNIMKSYGFTKQNPNFKNIDLLEEWVQAAHRKNIKIIPWIETFYVGNSYLGPILSKKPEWANIQKRNVNYDVLQPSNIEQGAFFMDPANPEVRMFLIRLISEMVTNYNIDGINLDYIRYPNCLPKYFPNYESSSWGYTSIAIAEFIALHKINPLTLDKNHMIWPKWNEYRQEKVTQLVQAIHSRIKNLNPKLKLSVVTFPNIESAKETKNQNWLDWVQNDYIDVLTPIILGSSPLYVYEETKNIATLTKDTNIEVYIGVFGTFNQDLPVTFIQQIEKAFEGGADGINIFDYKHIQKKYINALQLGPFRKDIYK